MLSTRAILYVFLAAVLAAQPQTSTLRGVLTDRTGAVIPSAAVTLTGDGVHKSAVSQIDGAYSFNALRPGEYRVRVAFPGFAPFERTVTIGEAANVQLPIQLMVTAAKQELTVQGQADSAVNVEPENNASAVVIKGDDLESLPDNSGDLNDMLQALAGPGAGPNGGELVVDGFSGGKLPNKSSIREIRINQNPFSAEYDRLGMGRIEILTKPGTEKLHGEFGVFDSDAVFNSRNPYAENKADYVNRFYEGSLSGALSKRASFRFLFEKDVINNNALIKAVTLDPATLTSVPLGISVPTPNRGYDLAPRIDYQLSTNHTLTARYDFGKSSSDNNGIGQYSLQSRAYSREYTEHEVHVNETAVLNAHAVNDTRFAFSRQRSDQYGNNAIPSINVSEAFQSGGAQVGRAYNIYTRYELQNNTSIGHGAHTFRFGARLRRATVSDEAPTNFGGTFTFFGVAGAPVLDANNQAIPGSFTDISSLEQYRRTLLFQKLGYGPSLIRQWGGGASQFSIAGGAPLAGVAQFDAGVFAQDDWRVRPNLTVSLGMRYEGQTNIHDHADFAPRIGVAWGPGAKQGKPSKTVIRVGAGLYYDRVNYNLTLQELRFNGVNQQQFLVMNPDFYPNVPALSSLQGQRQALNTYQKDVSLRTPMMVQTAISVERQLPKKTTLAATYMGTHSIHNLRTVNINSPQPGSGVRPYGALGNLFLYESDGALNQNLFMTSVNTRFSPKASLNFAFRMMSANSDTDNNGSPSNPYNFKQDYGRSGFMRRYQTMLMGTLKAPLKLQFNPMLIATSGAPYNLIVGSDLNGDTVSNDRPAFATDLSRPSVVSTPYGKFDTNPLPGQTIVPRNYLTGDPMWNLNCRVSRAFELGRHKGEAASSSGFQGPSASLTPQQVQGQGGGNERHYTLEFSAYVNNVFNHLNRGGYVGNLASPLFGQSTAIYLFRETSNNRRIQVGTNFTF